MKKLWLRISLTFLILLFFILLAMGFFIADMMKKTYMDMTRQQLLQDAHLVSKVIDISDLTSNNSTLQNSVERFYAKNQPRITIIDTSGRVLADSEDDPSKMDNHSNRPEFKNIVNLHKKMGESVRYSHTLGYNMMYVAIPIQQNNKLIGVVRSAYTLGKIEQAIVKLWVSLGLTMGVTLILSSVIGIKLAKGISRPIEEIIHVARNLSENNYKSRVRLKTTGEIRELSHAINVLAISLQKQMNEIHENQQKLTGVLTNMVSGVMLIHPNRRIALVNPAMEQIIGTKASELTGKLHIEAGKHFGLSQLIERCLEQGVKIHEEVSIYYPKERILDAHFAPLLGVNGDINGVITVLHDITDIRRLEKMRSEFVANVSHELKTPVTSLKGFAETLLDGAMYDEELCRSFLQIIYDESDRLHRLIADILHLSKIEQHQLPLHPEVLNIINVINETVQTLQEEVNKKKINIKLPDYNELYMEAEKDRIRQIILNLVANDLFHSRIN